MKKLILAILLCMAIVSNKTAEAAFVPPHVVAHQDDGNDQETMTYGVEGERYKLLAVNTHSDVMLFFDKFGGVIFECDYEMPYQTSDCVSAPFKSIGRNCTQCKGAFNDVFRVKP